MTSTIQGNPNSRLTASSVEDYISRLFAKELVVKNFAGSPPGELLERLIELSLYTEENLK